jgi:hypothetical protein
VGRRHVEQQPALRPGDPGAHHGDPLAAPHEARLGDKLAVALVADERRMEIDRKLKTAPVCADLGVADSKPGGRDVGKPDHRAGMHDSERAQDAGRDGHHRPYMLGIGFEDGKRDLAVPIPETSNVRHPACPLFPDAYRRARGRQS